MFKKVQMLALSLVLTTGFMVGCNKTDKNGEELKVTLVLDEGGVNDQSFNQSAWEGALKAQEDYNVEVKREGEPTKFDFEFKKYSNFYGGDI